MFINKEKKRTVCKLLNFLKFIYFERERERTRVCVEERQSERESQTGPGTISVQLDMGLELMNHEMS